MPALKDYGESDVVRLSRDFKSSAVSIPRGTEATILQVFGGGVGQARPRP